MALHATRDLRASVPPPGTALPDSTRVDWPDRCVGQFTQVSVACGVVIKDADKNSNRSFLHERPSLAL